MENQTTPTTPSDDRISTYGKRLLSLSNFILEDNTNPVSRIEFLLVEIRDLLKELVNK